MADNVNQNVAILSLMAKLEDNSKEISAQAKKMIGKVEKTAGTIEFGANTKEIQNAIERINKLIDGKLKGIDLTKQFGSILKVFSNAESSAEDYLNILDKVHNELFSISKLPKNSLDLMGNFSPKQVEQVLKVYDKLINKQEQYSKKLEESRKKAQSIEAKSLISLKRDYKGNTSYDTASSDTVIESLTKQIGLENNTTAKRDIKEYSQLLSIFNLLQDRKKELAKIDTVKAAEEEVQINKSLLNIVNEIATKEKRLSTAFGAKDLLSSSLEGFDTGEINRSILRSVDEYSTRASKVVKDSIKQLQNELDQTILDYSQKNVDKMVSAQEKASEKVKARIDKRSSSITSSTKGSQDSGIENIGDVAQDASENVQKLDNALENIGDDSGSNELDLWAKSAENLKEEFADVIKYAVDAETAFNRLNEIWKKYDKGLSITEDETTEMWGLMKRLDELELNGVSNNFQLNEDQIDEFREWEDDDSYSKMFNKIQDMTEKQLEEIEKLKVAQKELSEQPMLDSSSTSMMEKQIEETTEAVEKLEQSEKEVLDGAEQLEKKMSNSFNISQNEVSELIALVQDLANKLGSADFADNLFKNQNELTNAFKDIADEFGKSLNSNITEFADNLDSTTKGEFNFDNIRNELLSIVQQFQNSLQAVGLSSTQLDDAYKMIKGWNDASNIMVGSGEKDAERATLIGKKTGKVSNSYLYDKEGEFSGQILDKLNKLSAGVSGEISEIYDTWLHSHPFKKVLEGLKTIGSDVGFSVDDFNVYMNKYLEKGITNMMVTSNGKYTNIDWTGIVDKEVIKRVKENFAKSDIFVNGKFKGSLVESRDVHDFDKQTELINTEIIKAMSSAGIKDASSRLSTGNIEDLKVDVAQLQTEMNETQNDAQILYEVLDKISNALNEINAYGGFKFDGLDSLVASLEEVNRLLSEISNSIKSNTNNIPSVSSIQPQSDTTAIDNIQNELVETRKEAEKTEQAIKEIATTSQPEVNQTHLSLHEESSGQLAMFEGVEEQQKEIEVSVEKTNDAIEGQINLIDYMNEQASKAKQPELIQEPSGQLAMFEGLEQSQKEVEVAVEKTNDALEGQITLVDYLNEQKNKPVAEPIKDTFDVGSTSASVDQNVYDIKAETDAIKKNTNALKENAQAQKKKSETKEDTSNTRIHDVSKAWTAAIRENKVFDDNQTRLAIKNYEELIGKLDEYYALLAKEHKGQLTSDETALLNEFRDQIDKASKSIDEFKGKEKDLKDVVKKFNTRISEFDNDSGLIGLNGRNNTFESLSQEDVVSTKTNKYEAKLKDLESIILKIRKLVPIDVNNDEDVKELKDLNAQFDKLANNLSSDEYNPAKQIDIDALSGKISDTLHKNTAAPKEIRMQLEGLIAKLKEFGLSEADIQKVREEFVKLNSQMKATGKTGDSLGTKITKKFKDVAAYFATYVSIQDAIQVVRQAYQYVAEIDKQMIELEKVSDMSASRLAESFDHAKDAARDLGSTVSDVISATADWSRLGYDAYAAEQLAEVATIYKNVGDGIDISTANESLISTLQGFQMEASQAMEIVDSFNEVANRMPIDSAGIGEALQRSAASFNAANTSLSESISLITATNAVIQDPTSVGTMWKTVSARIRGAKTELEEMGEDTEGMVESTSKLRDLVKGMTGFDIMEDENTFKSIYDIMVGIGEEWENLSDIDQAALLEALAGKRAGNALAAALQNVDMIKEAYQIAEESSGSAMREQEKWEQGLEARTNKLKASLETLSTAVLDSDFLGGAIDAGRGFIDVLIEIIDTLGVIPTLLVGGSSIFAGFKSFQGEGRLKKSSLIFM